MDPSRAPGLQSHGEGCAVSKKCESSFCYAPEATCSLGELRHEDCPTWQKSTAAAEGTDSAPPTDGLALPWSGNSLGGADRSFATGRSSAKVVAVVGPAGAGKTTLLAAWYLLIGRGTELREHTFAGSYTLTGWENIAHALRWTSSGGPGFPPHTSSGSGRHPGLLHMALRKSVTGAVTDMFFADAPGEWFRLWAVNRDGAEASGARWISEHADVIVIIADSEALSGAERGIARSVLAQIFQRVGHERRGRSVAVVWTKSDVEVPPLLKSAIETSAKQHLGNHTTFSLTVRIESDPGGERPFMDLLHWVTEVRGESYSATPSRPDTNDNFLVFGHGQ